MNKKIANTIVVSVVVTAVICYILYLQDQKKKLLEDNDLLKKKLENDTQGDEFIINVSSVPEKLRPSFRKAISHPSNEEVDSYSECLRHIQFLKETVESKDGYRFFYKNGAPYVRERDIHFLYKLTWYETNFDVNSEVNNGRGPVDFKVSKGIDQTIVEFKLASNTRMKSNLQKQTEIYLKASREQPIVAITFSFYP